MANNFSVNFPKSKYIEEKADPVAVASHEELDNKVSFEKELTMANEATNKKEKDLLDKDEDFLPLFKLTEFIQKMYAGDMNNNMNMNIGMASTERSARLPENSQKTNENTDNLPSSLVKAASQASQKIFSEFSSRFQELFMAEIKNKGLFSEKPSSEFNVPKVNIDQIFAELVERVRMLKAGEVTHLKLDLKPENLGRLQVLLSLQDKKLVLHIFASDEAKKLIDTKIDDLQELLTKQGFNVEHMQVEVSAQQDQGQDQSAKYFSLANGKNVPYQAYDMLKIVQQADIINSIDKWLGDVIVNYIV